ncbi:MAG: M48 family metalloprotease [Holosporaceae bacterium]|jgi:predicted Zn-dependent protease|nr:M48 family metalloprotease [Holosporaceae bacterium]
MKWLRALLISVFVTAVQQPAWSLTLIRDAEVEDLLKEMLQSVFKVAGLNPKSAKVYVIKSSSINAFTIGNGYVFITSGLLFRFPNPLQILGILCHETAHIAARHIDRLITALKTSSRNSIFAILTGMLVAAVTGRQEAIAMILGYAETDLRLFLRFNRSEEMAADLLAATYLEKLGFAVDVFIDVLLAFERMDILNGNANLPAYLSDHPPTGDRMAALQKKVTNKQYTPPRELLCRFRRAQIKLLAYLGQHNLRTIAPQDEYAQTIYLRRTGKVREAIEILRTLVRDNPGDIYYKESLAQTLYEYGELPEAIRVYQEIYHKDVNMLIKVNLAHVLITAQQQLDQAISILEAATYVDDVDSNVYRLLSIAYGKQRKYGLAMFSLGMEQLLQQNFRLAEEIFTECLTKLDPKTEAPAIKKAKYYKELIERNFPEGLRFLSFFTK